jgi:signal transduction histidine kinase
MEKSKILLVDDNPINLQLLVDLLENVFEVFITNNPMEVIDLAEKIIPDLILLDIYMPGKDGYQLFDELKQNNITKDIPIIFITAKSDTEDIIKGFNLGAVDYVTKPFNMYEVQARVKRYVELKKAKEEIVKINKIKEKFFSIIAHDLKSPLASFSNSLEILDDSFYEMTDYDKKQMISSILKTSKNLYNLLNNLLIWSQSQTGRIEFSPQLNNIREIIENQLALLESQIKNKEITIVKNYGDDLVFADSKMLDTIIRNLVSNSIKFSRNGSKIYISTEKIDKDIIISIKDEGIGMSKEVQEKLFKINNLHTSLGVQGEKGTGLGLLICKEFVDIHKGEIWLESEPNKGTTFFVKIPIQQ